MTDRMSIPFFLSLASRLKNLDSLDPGTPTMVRSARPAVVRHSTRV